MKNPIGFPWEIGQYQNPDVVVPAKPPAPAPKPIPCPGKIIVYAGDVSLVANCAGFVGFGGGNPWVNPAVIAALQRAAAYAAKLQCPGPCNKVASIIWVGWNCGGGPPITAYAGVEIEVECVMTDPTAITAFKEACSGLKELPAPIFLGHGWSPPQKKKAPSKKKRAKR